MSESFDQMLGHRHFAAACFNEAWEYLDLPDRDATQVEAMLHAAHASMWHWLQVPEHTATNLSIGRWQLARVYTVAGRLEEARYWARRCLEVSEANRLPPFYLAYAHEAIARIARAAGRGDEAERHLARARELLAAVGDPEDRELLARDLASL